MNSTHKVSVYIYEVTAKYQHCTVRMSGMNSTHEVCINENISGNKIKRFGNNIYNL